MGALLSFLGGSVFRMIWGEVSSFVNKRQDHKFEIERMDKQAMLEDRAAERQARAIEQQAALGIKTIEVQRDAEIDKMETVAFAEAMKQAYTPTGIKWIDGWNAIIRPSFATVALALWIFKVCVQGFIMMDFDLELLAVIAGFYFADRTLRKMYK